MISEIATWESLSEEQQETLLVLSELDFPLTLRWNVSNKGLRRAGLIEKVSRDMDYTFKGVITDAGRALIPAAPAPESE